MTNHVRSEISIIPKPVLAIIEDYIPQRICMDNNVYDALIDQISGSIENEIWTEENPPQSLVDLLTNEANNPFIMDVLINLEGFDRMNWIDVYLFANKDIAPEILHKYKDKILVNFDVDKSTIDYTYENDTMLLADYIGEADANNKLATLRSLVNI